MDRRGDPLLAKEWSDSECSDFDDDAYLTSLMGDVDDDMEDDGAAAAEEEEWRPRAKMKRKAKRFKGDYESRRRFARLPPKHPKADFTDQRGGSHSDESTFCQYAALIAYPNSSYVFSDFHAGPGQVTFGSNFRRKIDCTIVHLPGQPATRDWSEILFLQYHEFWAHRGAAGLGHLDDCPRRRMKSPRRPAAKESDGAEAAAELKDCDELRSAYAEALTAVAPDRLRLRYKAVHECSFKHRSVPSMESLEDAAALRERSWTPAVKVKIHVPTWQARERFQAYGRSANVGYGDGSYWWQTAREKRSNNPARGYLAALFPKDSVLGPPDDLMYAGFGLRPPLSQTELIDIIMGEGYCDLDDNPLGGFVVIRGGRETAEGGGNFGYCHQRTRPSAVGAFTRFQCERGGRDLKAALSKEYTFAKTSFDDGAGRETTLSLDYFRFLMEERGLKDFEIKHFVCYENRKYLSDFIGQLLQMRHDIKRGAPNPFSSETAGGGLGDSCAKLFINGFYGFTGVEASSYTKTRLLTDKRLRRKELRAKYLDNLSEDFLRINLVGVLQPQPAQQQPSARTQRKTAALKKGLINSNPPSLLYALTTHNKGASICNVSQVAATILGSSRRIFFDLRDRLHRFLNPGKAECSYWGKRSRSIKCGSAPSPPLINFFSFSARADTDSFIFATFKPDLDDCVRSPLKEEWLRAGRAGLLEDPNSASEQSGKFKIEGVWSAAYMRSCKAYYLFNAPVSDEEETATAAAAAAATAGRSDETLRMRSVPRRALYSLQQQSADDSTGGGGSRLDALFGQDSARNAPSIRLLQMKPTVGFEVIMLNQSRSVPHSINVKRIMPVHFFFIFKKIFFLSKNND